MMSVRFRLRGVRKVYPNRRRGARTEAAVTALDGVDLDIGEGQVNALVGRSGAGKSTLARIVIGFEAPDAGEVLYRGRPLSAAPRRDFCRCNQMVFQNPSLAVNPLFTVERIIGEPLFIAGSSHPGARIREAMDWMELPGDCLHRLPHELSGGELQRVALARALVLKPQFLALDEPFSSLDDLTAMRILLLLKGVFRRLGLGVLFVSHHPRHVRALADSVMVLEKGKVVAGGGRP